MKSSGYNARLDVIIPLKANMEPWKMGWMVVVTSCKEQDHIGGCHSSYTLSGLNPHFWLSTSPHLVFFIHNIDFVLGRIWWSSLSAISMRVHVLSRMNIIRIYIYIYILVGGLEHFFIIYGMSSFPLTNSYCLRLFFTTNQIFIYIYIYWFIYLFIMLKVRNALGCFR